MRCFRRLQMAAPAVVSPTQAGVHTPQGVLEASKVHQIFEQVGFEPPPGMPLQDAFNLLLRRMQGQKRAQQTTRKARGRTAVPCEFADVPFILERHGASSVRMFPFGAEVLGVDTTQPLHCDLAGALEMLIRASYSSASRVRRSKRAAFVVLICRVNSSARCPNLSERENCIPRTEYTPRRQIATCSGFPTIPITASTKWVPSGTMMEPSCAMCLAMSSCT